MIKILSENPILLLFLVSGIGYAIGELKIKGFVLGITGVLFSGLIIGAIDQRLRIPEYIYVLGLVIFTYTLGISNGSGFYRLIKKDGLRDNIFAFVSIFIGFLCTIIFSLIFELKSTFSGGLFAGSLTNTTAMASLLDSIKYKYNGNEQLSNILSEPVISYSIAYIFGLIGTMFSIVVFEKLFKINYKDEVKFLKKIGINSGNIITKTALINNFDEINLKNIFEKNNLNVVPVRMKKKNKTDIISEQTILNNGDLVSLMGEEEDINRSLQIIGNEIDESLDLSRKNLDFMRIFVSRHSIAGKKISELNVTKKFGALITRIRRGDTDIVANDNFVLELGDRVRIIAPPDQMDNLIKFFGDSYKSLSEINLLTFGIGISLGLIVGLIPIPLFGITTFKLGFAGGPLLVGLLLGIIGKTGKISWSMSYNANLTLRQIGLSFFLAVMGTNSGYLFFSTVFSKLGFQLFVSGLLITIIVCSFILYVGYKYLKIPMSFLVGTLAGIQTQTAVLGFVSKRIKNEAPTIAYTLVYPFSTIIKILFIQILFLL